MKENKGAKRAGERIMRKAKPKPIVTNSNVIIYPRGFKKWLKRNGFLIKEFGLYYDKNCGSKKKCNYAKCYATSISELLRDFHMQKKEEKKNN
jgi:hypothetical protein